MNRKKKEEIRRKLKEWQAPREAYAFIAHVRGPLLTYEVSAKDLDEAYQVGRGLLHKELEKYKGEVTIEKVEVLKYADLPF